MTSSRIHTCIYFDDGAEHWCVCGSRAYLVVDEEGSDPVLVVLDDEPSRASGTAARPVHDLAISA